MNIKKQYENVKSAIDSLYSGVCSAQDIVFYLEELEDYISIRLEALRKQIEKENDGS